MLIEGQDHPVLPAVVVAAAKGCPRESVYRALRSGRLNGYQSGGLWLVMNDETLKDWRPGGAGRPRTKQRRPARSAAMKEAADG